MVDHWLMCGHSPLVCCCFVNCTYSLDTLSWNQLSFFKKTVPPRFTVIAMPSIDTGIFIFGGYVPKYSRSYDLFNDFYNYDPSKFSVL